MTLAGTERGHCDQGKRPGAFKWVRGSRNCLLKQPNKGSKSANMLLNIRNESCFWENGWTKYGNGFLLIQRHLPEDQEICALRTSLWEGQVGREREELSDVDLINWEVLIFWTNLFFYLTFLSVSSFVHVNKAIWWNTKEISVSTKRLAWIVKN